MDWKWGKPSKYFFNLEKYRAASKAIHYLKHKRKEMKGAKMLLIHVKHPWFSPPGRLENFM